MPFFRKEISYLGYIVFATGVSTSQDKIKVVQEWPRPKTVKDLRSFLAFASYYWRFVHHFAQVAKPLYELISEANKEKGSKGNELLQSLWNQKSEDAFRELKDRLTSSSILVMQTLLDPSYWRRTLAAWTLGSPNAKPGGREKSYCICEPHSTKGRKEWC